MYDIIELNNKLVAELKEIAKELNIDKYEGLKKQDLIYRILDQQALSPAKNSEEPKDSYDKRPGVADGEYPRMAMKESLQVNLKKLIILLMRGRLLQKSPNQKLKKPPKKKHWGASKERSFQ